MKKKNKTTNDLIKSLSGDLSEVRPLAPPYKRALVWSGVFLTFMAVAAFVLEGFRHDAAVKITSPEFIVETLMLVLIGVLSLFAGFKLAVPDIRYGKLPFVIIGGILALGIGANAALFFLSDTHHIHGQIEQHNMFYHCVTNLGLLMLVPTVAVYILLKKSAPVLPVWAGYAVFLGVTAFAAATMRHVCGMDGAAHLLIWHFLPALGISFVGMIIGAFLLRW
ncbi:MAG: DUF1109 domain-containing protein [Micavibrio sp.]|nr:MAG: DUF1109 domain-containing protein [Micavibrio sp.]